MPQKHALLIGVNNYPVLGEEYKLWGCVNDAQLVGSVLRDRFGFPDDRITYLLDDKATEAAIRAQMQALAERVGKDDVVVFHFSGHGSRKPSQDPAEASGKDSTIMPHDSGRRPHPNLDIPDKDINAWLEGLTQKTSNITLIFDCCHSGTITRDAFGDRARSVPDDDRTLEELGLTMHQPAPADATRSVPTGPRKGGFQAFSDKYLVMSACQDDELAREFKITRGDESFQTGALTHYLTEALVAAAPGSTYRDVFETVRNRIQARYDTQHPQIEGTRDRELFGTRDLEPMRFVSIGRVDGDSVTLSGGAAHGLHTDSIWHAYPPGTKKVDGQHDAVLRIDSVSSLKSEATVIERRGEPSVQGRCVEHSASPAQFVMGVALPDGAADLGSAVDESKLLRPCSPDEADLRIYALEARDGAGENDPVPQHPVLSTPVWACVNSDGRLAMPLVPQAEHGALERVVSNLGVLARFRNALTLDNPQSNLDVEFNIYRMNDNNEWVLANGGDTVYNVGDRMSFEIINNESFDVHFSVLDFTLTGQVSVLYPGQTGSEKLPGGRSVRLARGENALRMAWEEGVDGNEGAETFKAFVTREASDFRWLEQQGTRSTGAQSRLDALFKAAYLGPTTRAGAWDFADNSGSEDNADDWRAISRGFRVRNTTT